VWIAIFRQRTIHGEHYSAKLVLGMRDVWGYLTKDTADIDWDKKSELENAV